MFLNGYPGRKGPGVPGPAVTYFDFAVAERPKYVPGFGPPLAPITPMPVHNRDGIIFDLIQIGEGNPRYVVGYEAKPSLRISVKLENILDWVSARTYEDWQYDRTVEQEKILEDAALPRFKYKEEKEKATSMRRARMTGKGSSEESEMGQEPKTRKRKRTMSVEPVGQSRKETRAIPGMGLGMVTTAPYRPGQRRKSVIEKEPAFTSPKSVQQASLSSPNKQRGLAEVFQAETEDEDDQEDTELALQMQLNPGFAAHSVDPDLQNSRSASVSQEEPYDSHHSPPKSKLSQQIRPPRSHYKQSSAASRSPSFVSSGSDRRHKQRPNQGSAVAATSNWEAKSTYEKLEPKNKSKFVKADQTISQMYTYRPNEKLSPVSQTVANEEEYEVDSILDDEIRSVNGKHMQFYLIKWTGEWDDTWEPASFVGEGSIKDYRRLKTHEKQRGKGKGIIPAEKTDNPATSELIELGRNGKILRQRPQGSGGLDDDGDMQMDIKASSDEDTLFLSDTQRIWNAQDHQPKGKGLRRPIQLPGEFIEIEGSDES